MTGFHMNVSIFSRKKHNYFPSHSQFTVHVNVSFGFANEAIYFTSMSCSMNLNDMYEQFV
jgi:hypothetical protein